MKVLLVNGSSRNNGCTATALKQVASTLEAEGIETETFFIGNEALPDCIACRKCHTTGRCIFDDSVNIFVDAARKADGFVFGSPVYYAHPSARLLTFMDRAFYSGGDAFRFKPGAAVLSARRAGTVASFDVINKYFTIARMPVVASQYWNSVHGNNAEEVVQDKEGMQIMRTLGDNMAWLIKCIAAGKAAGINPPTPEAWEPTNFIR